MSTQFNVTQVNWIQSSVLITPIIFVVTAPAGAVTGYAIPASPTGIGPMKIAGSTPILRVFTKDGSYTITPDVHSASEVYIWVASDRAPNNTKQLWLGANTPQNFLLTVDYTQTGDGVNAFSLTPV